MLGFGPEIVRDKARLPELHAKLDRARRRRDWPSELEIGEPTLRDICDALARPDRDPRDDLPKPIFKKGVLKLEDLQPGMELKGTVLNVVDFGAFVDIGLKDSGLVHISQLANRYIKSPHDVVSVGDVVTAWVMGVDHERKRVSLTMVKPGTERPRGGAGGGGGGGRRGGERGERRGGGGGGASGGGAPGGRPPRRERAGGPGPVQTPEGAGGAPPAGAGGEAAAPAARRHEPAGRGQGRGPGQGQGPRTGGGPPGRGGQGGRPFQGGRGGGGGAAQAGGDRNTAPRPPARPSKPAPPPPPLSKDALSGSVPLRTFGQLKQLWQARTTDGPTDEPASASEPSAEPPLQTPPTPPQPPADVPEPPAGASHGGESA